jgi:predicted nucleic acid-binding protein
MTAESHARGLVDTNVMILRRWISPGDLPAEIAISAITLAELSAGPHEVRGTLEQSEYDEHAERARRLDVLQRAENEFEPIPFGVEAARAYGQVTAAVISAGRKPRRRVADLMIASVAIAENLPLFTTNPGDFAGLDGLLTVVSVARPDGPHDHDR